MIIGACGFTGSGSSAVSDYLKEFSSVCALDQFEFILAHSPDGLEDLDFQLNKHCSKYTSSEVAIKRFRLNVNNYLIKKIKDKDKKEIVHNLTEDFISSITQVEWMGLGSADYQLNTGVVERFLFDFGKRLLAYLPDKTRTNYDKYPAHKMEFSIQPQDFCTLAKEYVKSILEVLGADFSKPIVLDQPFSGNNPQFAFPYFDNPKAIIVDRDPRDLYVIAKTFYHKNGVAYQVPTDTVENFISYYLYMRLNQPYSQKDERILLIKLEDLIYNYEQTRIIINSFCGLNDSDRNKKLFDPELSINNTQVFKRHPELKDDITKIEKSLGNYMYDFEKYGDIKINGKMFINRSPLNK